MWLRVTKLFEVLLSKTYRDKDMQNKQTMQNNVLNKTYQISNNLNISPEVLRSHVKFLWFDIFKPLHDSNANIHLMLMCKIGYNENNNTEYKTIADLRRVNYTDRDIFIEYLLDRLGILSDSYNIKTCTCITFTYVVKDGLADDDRQLISNSEYTVNTHNYNNLKLPLTMDCSEYGSLLATQQFDDYIRHIFKNDLRIYESLTSVYGQYLVLADCCLALLLFQLVPSYNYLDLDN